MELSGEHDENGVELPERVDAAPSVWMVPFVFGSHLLCFAQLATKLASHGLRVKIFSSTAELEHLRKSKSEMIESWGRRGLDIRLQDLEMRPTPWVYGPTMYKSLEEVMEASEEAFEVILEAERVSGWRSRPSCVIGDMWLPRVRETALEHGIPAWAFCTFPSAYVSTLIYVLQLSSTGILQLPSLPLDEESREELISVPGLGLFRMADIPTTHFKGNPLYAGANRTTASVKSSEVVLLSTFQELEPRTLRDLRRILEAAAIRDGRKLPHIWTVGPTFSLLPESNNTQVKEEQRHPTLEFLDSQPPASVLLVTFGGLVRHTREQIEEIAWGLEKSEQPFLCVLQSPNMTTDSIFSVIHADCLEKTKSRGLFVQGWVPQLKVLAHPSTGGFLSHCGFNSILESMYMGVPMLAWPSFEDQFVNCRFVVDEAKVGLEIKGAEGFVGREEVERSVRALFSNQEVRNNALKMRQKAQEAVGENGSSTNNVQALVALIKGLAK